MVVSSEHLSLEVVTDFINQVYFKEWLTADKIPYHTRLREFLFMVENIIYCSLCYLSGHAFFRILPYEVAILASQLAVLGDNEGDVLRHAGLSNHSLCNHSIKNLITIHA